MCRNIRPLFNFEPPATTAEIEAAALQFVRKLSGFNSPSQVNQLALLKIVQISMYDSMASEQHDGTIPLH